ncbi:hypothetical protein [Streptomyces liangshanensis]|uniref:Uncharacterized protein n=1 Tax=Streptomyces liangshanensis TaxID=2717324 RepID=A0A6G9GSW5_9ACTN|nr:hypothetical protein [Streptomyces liangshanensis]QIQ01294.1 hypothetical protein HA039_02375 [Streptomyces liangshanensis]
MKTADRPAAQVVVALSGQDQNDAHTVFSALRTAFGSDRPADDVPQAASGGRPAVWTATFDADDVRDEPAAARLSAPVTATLQGGYTAVDSLRRALTAAFAVRMVGTASGDQEEEVQLRLESR